MNRIALATAGLLLTSGVAVAVPFVAGSSASAAQDTICDSNSWMNRDYRTVQHDKAKIKVQKAKIKTIKRAEKKAKTAKARKADRKKLYAANATLRRERTKLKHDQRVYDNDVPCDPNYAPPGSSASASPSASASTSASSNPSMSASTSPSASSSTSTTTSPSASSSSGGNPLCGVLPLPVIC